MLKRNRFLGVLFALGFAAAIFMAPHSAHAASAAEIDRDADSALMKL